MGRTSRAVSAARMPVPCAHLAQPAQRIQPAIDCRWSLAGCDHVLAVGDEFVFSEAFDGEGAVLDGPVPRQEVAQVVMR